MNPIRPAAVAGTFYPGAARELAREVAHLIAGVQRPPLAQRAPKAIIAPHAGYIYSGPVAASVYALLEPAREQIRRVVLLGPTHRVAIRGLALPGAEGFATPLDVVEIDRIVSARAAAGHGERQPMPWNINSKCICRSCRRCSALHAGAAGGGRC